MLTGVTAETFRHWRKSVPYLTAKAGKAARFSFAELIALAIVNELVNSLGVHIGSVSVGVNHLFGLLAQANSSVLLEAIAFVTPTNAELHDGRSLSPATLLGKPTLVIPLNPLIARMQQHMLPLAPGSDQAALPFPPKAIRGKV